MTVPEKTLNQDSVEKYLNKVVEYGIFLLLFLPLVFLPFYTQDMYALPKVTFLRLLVLGLIGTWGLKIIYTRKLEFRRSPLDLPILFFFLLLILSTIFSLNPSISLLGRFKRHEGLFTWISYLFLFFATTNFILRSKQTRRLLTTLVLVSVPISIYGIFQHFGWDFLSYAEAVDITRSFSTLGNPVFFGTYLTLVIPLALSLLFQKGTLSRKFLWGGIGALALLSLVYTYGRGAWLGALGALIIFGVFLPKEELRKRWKGKTILILIGVVIIIILIFLGALIPAPIPTGKLLLERASSVVNWQKGTAATRLEMWKSTLGIIGERPFLGWGLENFTDIFPKYRSLKLERLEGEWSIVDRPHNETLYIASSLGILGLLTYLSLIFIFLFQSLKYLRKTNNSESRVFLSGCIAAIVGYLIQAQFAISVVEVTPLFWVLMGVIMAQGRILGIEKEKIFLKEKLFPQSKSLRIIFSVIFSVLLLFFILLMAFFTLKFLVADYYYRLSLLHSPSGEKAEIKAPEKGILQNHGQDQRSLGRSLEKMYSEGQIRNLKEAVALNPFENRYRLELGIAYFKKARSTRERLSLEQAIAVYQKALEFNPRDGEVYFNLGNAYSFYGRATGDQRMLGLALGAYQKAVEIDPLFSWSHWNMGFIYILMDKLKEGIKHYEEAVKINPNNSLLWNYLGAVYEEMGRIKEAKKSYRKALKLNPKLKSAQERLNLLEKQPKP